MCEDARPTGVWISNCERWRGWRAGATCLRWLRSWGLDADGCMNGVVAMGREAPRPCAAWAGPGQLSDRPRHWHGVRSRLDGSSGSPSWSAPLASSSWTWIFFAQPCGGSRRDAGRPADLAARRLRGDPRDDAAARRSCTDRTILPAGWCQPGGGLLALAGLHAAARRDSAARRGAASVDCLFARGVSADHGAAAPGRLGGEPQAGGAAAAIGQPAVPAQACLPSGDDGQPASLRDPSDPGRSGGADDGEPAHSKQPYRYRHADGR